MKGKDSLAGNFEKERPRLQLTAHRMLGSIAEAEDAVQEAWFRLQRTDTQTIESLGSWLTTTVGRICLDMLRTRKSRREDLLGNDDAVIPGEGPSSPEVELSLAEAIGPALLVVMDKLSPVERVAFVLHDLFGMSFEAIAPIVDKTESATRQLASRARRRVQGAEAPEERSNRQREIVLAFLSASRLGDFQALIRLLHPHARLYADTTAVKVAQINRSKGAPQFEPEITGAKRVAETFEGKAAAAEFAWLDGAAGATWAPGGKPSVAFRFEIEEDRIVSIEVVMNLRDLHAIVIEIERVEPNES